MLIYSLLILSSLAFELLGIIMLVTNEYPWYVVIFIHLFACMLAIYSISRRKKYFHNYNKSTAYMLFSIAFLIPFFGVLGVFIIARWLRVSQSRFHKVRIKDVTLEDLIQPLRTSYGIGGLRKRLENKDLSVNARISALNSISLLGSSSSNLLIRTMLPENQDELRLLAFYLLGKQEKKYIPKISKALNLLQHETNEWNKAEIYKNIAIEYWELIYHGLVEDNLVDFVLNLSLKYGLLAENMLRDDSGLAFLLGRIYLSLKNYQKAMEFLYKAKTDGAMLSRVSPYLAEAYYYQQKYPEIKQIMSQSAAIDLGYTDSLSAFWSDKNE